MYFIEVVSSVI